MFLSSLISHNSGQIVSLSLCDPGLHHISGHQFSRGFYEKQSVNSRGISVRTSDIDTVFGKVSFYKYIKYLTYVRLVQIKSNGLLQLHQFIASCCCGLSGNLVVEIDGVGYDPDENGDVYVPTKDAKLALIYEYNKLGGDVHEQYPVGMKLALLTYTDKGYQAEYPAVLQNLLHYAGSSIRITGKKGIRMITGIDTKQRDQLIQGSAGYTLLEYGTLVAWDYEIYGTVLTLEHPSAKTAFAYKKGEADPVYKVTSSDTQFTNVLVGFSNDQCVPDLTVYGGVVHRSIGYIALQNRKAFQPGTDSYEYIWSIIHHVYGTKYDADYKK